MNEVYTSVTKPIINPLKHPLNAAQNGPNWDYCGKVLLLDVTSCNLNPPEGINQAVNPYNTTIINTVDTINCIFNVNSIELFPTFNYRANNDTNNDTIIPEAVIVNGYNNAGTLSFNSSEVAAITNAAHVDSANDPNKSLPIPAISPTLSPTLSAIVAGLLGSSSSILLLTLPTKSAPISAALVYIPPPTLPNNAMVDPPNPYPDNLSVNSE